MNGASQFIEKNFKSPHPTFDACMNSIVYGFLLLAKEKKYSRKSILTKTESVRGRKAKIIELEDYLRNDLVKNYIEPHLEKFGLQKFLFIPGAEETQDNIKTGVLDIKVCSPLLTGKVYYIFECKRLNKSIIAGYIKEGIQRFIDGKYYPETMTPVAGIISFLESLDLNNKINIDECFEKLNAAITSQSQQIALVSKLKNHKLDCKDFTDVRDYKYVFSSFHKRKKIDLDIALFHIALDYNELITT
jgi:hypothetical protein